MSFSFHVVIPCRYEASRLPGKALLDIGGKTLIQHVYDSAINSQAQSVTIATDDERIEDVARSFGAEVMMTSVEHKSGTDRICEIIKRKNIKDEVIVVNVQGDEFGLPSTLIDQVASTLNDNREKQMATLCEKITDNQDLGNPDVVKVVRDINDNAIYFSRSAIPWQNSSANTGEPVSQTYRHIGLYAYRAGFLKQFSDLHACTLENAEKLEQLRALYNGYAIHVAEACAQCGIGIDTDSDLQKARKLCQKTDQR